jgi:hypothetical protein
VQAAFKKDVSVALPLVTSAATHGAGFDGIVPKKVIHQRFSSCIKFLGEKFDQLPNEVKNHLQRSFESRFVGGNAIGSFPALQLSAEESAKGNENFAHTAALIQRMGQDLASSDGSPHPKIERDLQQIQFVCMCVDTITDNDLQKYFKTGSSESNPACVKFAASAGIDANKLIQISSDIRSTPMFQEYDFKKIDDKIIGTICDQFLASPPGNKPLESVLNTYFTKLRSAERPKIGYRGRANRNADDLDLQRSDQKATRLATLQATDRKTCQQFRTVAESYEGVKDFLYQLESVDSGKQSLCSAAKIPPGAPCFTMLSEERMRFINDPKSFLMGDLE